MFIFETDKYWEFGNSDISYIGVTIFKLEYDCKARWIPDICRAFLRLCANRLLPQIKLQTPIAFIDIGLAVFNIRILRQTRQGITHYI